jgi:GTP-binding protein
MNIFRHAQFEISCAKPSGLPKSKAAEIAFAGRSNAGKSSAINTICGHTRLAYVSKTPGRTQLINVFRMKNGAALIDLPGYGYAKVPEPVRRDWSALLEHYLSRRNNLVGLVLIMDARRPLLPLDWQMINWFAPSARPIHCLLTKSDKLTRQEQAKVLVETRAKLTEYEGRVTVQLFSSLKKSGIDEVGQVVSTWLPDLSDDTLAQFAAAAVVAEDAADDAADDASSADINDATDADNSADPDAAI